MDPEQDEVRLARRVFSPSHSDDGVNYVASQIIWVKNIFASAFHWM
ncbi:hypothetical protein [Streptomyces longwoodensis]